MHTIMIFSANCATSPSSWKETFNAKYVSMRWRHNKKCKCVWVHVVWLKSCLCIHKCVLMCDDNNCFVWTRKVNVNVNVVHFLWHANGADLRFNASHRWLIAFKLISLSFPCVCMIKIQIVSSSFQVLKQYALASMMRTLSNHSYNILTVVHLLLC